MDPGEVHPLFNFNFNSRFFVCSNPKTSQPRVIYLFMPRFIMPSSRARALVAFPPPLPLHSSSWIDGELQIVS